MEIEKRLISLDELAERWKVTPDVVIDFSMNAKISIIAHLSLPDGLSFPNGCPFPNCFLVSIREGEGIAPVAGWFRIDPSDMGGFLTRSTVSCCTFFTISNPALAVPRKKVKKILENGAVEDSYERSLIDVKREDLRVSIEEIEDFESKHQELFIQREQQPACKKGPDPEKSSVAALSILLKIIKRAKKKGLTFPLGTGEELKIFFDSLKIKNLSGSTIGTKITLGNEEIAPDLEKINHAIDELFTSVPVKNTKK